MVAQVEVDRGGPDPGAVGVEGDRDGLAALLVEQVGVEAAGGQRQRRAVEVAQQGLAVGLVDRRPVDRRAPVRAGGVEDAGDPERRLERGHPPDQPLRHVLLVAGEGAQVVGVGGGRRRGEPLRFVAVVLEVVGRGLVELVAGVVPGAAALAVHPGAQPAEERGRVLGDLERLHGLVLERHPRGRLGVPAQGAVLDPDGLPVLGRRPQQRQPDLLDQGVLFGRVQLRRLCHGDIFSCRFALGIRWDLASGACLRR
ncbi:hypothetical protein UO65_2665 [Actinokineospora spheciospongiae]|uniref:Uncharacterized protein n=1 Tax=Actinokineospora spheciospongiae TaxID=909613 RepID=W7J7J3_9PSEU|nr:hypothetical protein UO65_2665 [Actinokineospora spheciospongiae]